MPYTYIARIALRSSADCVSTVPLRINIASTIAPCSPAESRLGSGVTSVHKSWSAGGFGCLICRAGCHSNDDGPRDGHSLQLVAVQSRLSIAIKSRNRILLVVSSLSMCIDAVQMCPCNLIRIVITIAHFQNLHALRGAALISWLSSPHQSRIDIVPKCISVRTTKELYLAVSNDHDPYLYHASSP